MTRTWLTPSLALGFLIVAGCDQPGGPARPQTRAPGLVGVDLDTSVESVPPVAPARPAPPPAEPKREPLIGAKTQEIRDAAQEKQAGVGAPAPKMISKDPFRVYGNAYVSAISQTSISNIKHAVDLYQAETGEFPKNHDEFMEKIIKANNIVLPKLPPTRKYVYDVATHELGIWEYPEGK